MSASNPFVLTNATRFHPVTSRGHSRSPSRSPLRKSQFAARELDPLLSNLSPDSTLKALQATATITSGSVGQDALAKSIAEASPAEREIGIRAAVAAQKLKEWHLEVSKWPWPARRDRGWGAGFLPPQKGPGQGSPMESIPYLGFLPVFRVQEYQERIEDVRDGIEALEIDDVKDHIFSAHIPQRSVSAPLSIGNSPDTRATGYGRMRDFTALITATVIQALPELANLTMLLDTWDIRLSVLRQIPDVTQAFRSTRAGVKTAFSVVRDAQRGPLVTMEEYETTKNILGGKVASLGTKIDRLLDMLEGQEDSLPKTWIDTLEDVESEYATWVVEAEHVAIRNNILSKALAKEPKLLGESSCSTSEDAIDSPTPAPAIDQLAEQGGATEEQIGTPLAELPESHLFQNPSPGRKLPRRLDPSKKVPLSISVPHPGHNRGVSEVSMADSAYSAISDLSTAEIVDAKSTQMVMSPRISVVDNPFRASREELSLFKTPALDSSSQARPPILQRASTASIEVFSRNSVRKVTLLRSRSHDLLSQISPITPHATTPSQALQQLSGSSRTPTPPSEQLENDSDSTSIAENAAMLQTSSSTASPTPSLQVEPLNLRGKSTADRDVEMPTLPRRSSKRLSQSFPGDVAYSNPLTTIRTPDEAQPQSETVTPVRSATESAGESLDAKIKDILDAMPNKIRLAQDSDKDFSQQRMSTPPTRSSTPLPVLTLSPVKPDRTNRQAAPGDVRLYHLTKSGQPRDVAPVKLFVRAVGEHGERVMVRVGGGWADLAEYLREYSLHHGHRGLNDGGLEVASFPSPQASQKDGSGSPLATASAPPKGHTASPQVNTKRSSFPSANPFSGEPSPLSVGKIRKNGRGKSSDVESSGTEHGWTPPPVPPIPETYTMSTPTTVTSTVNGITNTNTIQPFNIGMVSNERSVSAPVSFSSSANGRRSSTTVTASLSPHGGANYTPLGGAGPKSNGRRVAAPNPKSNMARESWVEGMVDKARAVSNGNTMVQHGPTTTTTTTVVSRSIPAGRRISSFTNFSPRSSPSVTNPAAPSPEAPSPDSTASKSSSPPPARPKSRMSLGDVNGIKRVFLRRKSDKQL